MIDIAIHGLLLANAQVAALAGTRGYPLVLPEDDATFPAFTYQLISSPATYTIDGPLGLFRTRLQIDCWAKRYLPAAQLDAAIFAVLDGFTGQLANGPMVYETERDDASRGFEPNARLYRCQSDWLILHGS